MGMVVGIKSKNKKNVHVIYELEEKKMSTSSTNLRPSDEFLGSSRRFMLYSRSLPHRLDWGSRILSRHERERRGVGHTFVDRGTPRGCWRRRGRHSDCQCRGGAGSGSDEISATFGSPTCNTPCL
jgi:hypothetical protein